MVTGKMLPGFLVPFSLRLHQPVPSCVRALGKSLGAAPRLNLVRKAHQSLKGCDSCDSSMSRSVLLPGIWYLLSVQVKGT